MLAANVCTAEFLAERAAAGALSRARGPDAREARAAARSSSAAAALTLGGGDEPTAIGLREAADRHPGAARLRAAADGAAALAAAGAVPPGQRRPLRPLLRGLRALHLADPPLSGSRSSIARSRRCSPGTQYTPGGTSWAELGAHCSLTERRADEATRDVENWLKCYFMQDKVGETFGGTISGVTSFGIFVTLDDLNIDGLVHVTELGRDYFHFDAARHAMIGERSGRSFQLAGRVRVKVARVDLETHEDRLHAGRRSGGAGGGRARRAVPRAARRQPEPARRTQPRPRRVRAKPGAHARRCRGRDGSRHPGAAGRCRATSRSIARWPARRASTALDGGGQRGVSAAARERSAPASPSSARRPAYDCGVRPARSSRARGVRLVAMDMDSTLITIECIDEIADLHGIKPEVAAITAAAMRGEIDFRGEPARAASRCSPACRSPALERVYDERLRLSPGAERLLAGFDAAGAKTLLVSGGFTFFTDRLRARLGVRRRRGEHARNRRRPAHRPPRGPIVDAAAKGARFATCARRRCADGGARRWRSATAPTTCRCSAPPTSRSPTARSRSCARRRHYAIDHCGLDAVLNLFA